MRIFDGKTYRDLTPEEIAAMQVEAERAEAAYWATANYAEAVNAKIRERYSVADEFALLRQMIQKPTEFAEYFSFCEETKAFVKAQIAKYKEE